MASKQILVRNAHFNDIDERISTYAEITAGGEGKECKVELLEDAATGEFFLQFPDDIPYYHFTVLLNALSMPWINNEGAKAAGWAEVKPGEGEYMHIVAKPESDVLVAVNSKNEGIIVVGGETSPLTTTQDLPVQFFAPSAEVEKLKPVASYGLILEDFDAEEEDDDDEVVSPVSSTPAEPVEVKKMSITTVIIIIVVVSAALIGLFLLAD